METINELNKILTDEKVSAEKKQQILLHIQEKLKVDSIKDTLEGEHRRDRDTLAAISRHTHKKLDGIGDTLKAIHNLITSHLTQE